VRLKMLTFIVSRHIPSVTAGGNVHSIGVSLLIYNATESNKPKSK
jgi:hypothetical protein